MAKTSIEYLENNKNCYTKLVMILANLKSETSSIRSWNKTSNFFDVIYVVFLLCNSTCWEKT